MADKETAGKEARQMEFLIDILLDMLVEPILRGLRKLYDMFFDFTLFHPKLGTVGMALVLFALGCALLTCRGKQRKD